MTGESAPSKKKPDASWWPVLMSVVVYPGIGQWMQRRQTAGTIYVAFFTIVAALFTLTLYRFLSEFIPFYKQILYGNLPDEINLPPTSSILKPFAVVLFLYLANVVDVLRGRYQLIRDQKEA